ncbi:MAG: hypothetical protein IPI56_10915 [Elusimicrobia bacterium]|nr:hypothetical protein [Elusimicrobiota bacterium]
MVMVNEGAGSFENPEPGSYAAVCNQVIDLGTQEGEYQGNKIKRRQVILGWELTEKNSKGEPFRVSSFYTASLSEKSKLRPMLESWRGAAFSTEELKGFPLSKLLGKPCLVSLILNEKQRIRVSSVSKLPKGMPAPTNTTPIVDFDLDKYDSIAFSKLSPQTSGHG